MTLPWGLLFKLTPAQHRGAIVGPRADDEGYRAAARRPARRARDRPLSALPRVDRRLPDPVADLRASRSSPRSRSSRRSSAPSRAGLPAGRNRNSVEPEPVDLFVGDVEERHRADVEERQRVVAAAVDARERPVELRHAGDGVADDEPLRRVPGRGSVEREDRGGAALPELDARALRRERRVVEVPGRVPAAAAAPVVVPTPPRPAPASSPAGARRG